MTGMDWQQKYGATLWVCLAVFLAGAAFFFWDWQAHRPVGPEQIQTGQVVSREMTTVAGFMQRPLLTIHVDGTSDIVKAVLLTNASRSVPDRVSFHSPPADSSDVQLQEETSSLTVALLLLAFAVGTAAVLFLLPGWSRAEVQKRGHR